MNSPFINPRFFDSDLEAVEISLAKSQSFFSLVFVLVCFHSDVFADSVPIVGIYLLYGFLIVHRNVPEQG